MRLRCHTGYAFSLSALMTEVTKSIETSLRNSLRAIEESQLLMSQVAEHLCENGDTEAAELLTQKVEDTRQKAEAHQAISS